MDVVEQVTHAEPLIPVEVIDEPEVATSVKDHAAQFSPNAPKEEPPADELKPIRPVDQQKRDQGKFAEGKQRIKASEAVQRINTLTSRAKTAEERLAAAEKELATLKSGGGTRTEIKQAEQKVERAEAKVESATFSEPEPAEDDPKFDGDYGKYMRAVASWEGRKAYHDARQAEHQQQEQARAEQSERETMKAALTRADAAAQKYADFEEVAMKTPAKWLDPKTGKPTEAGKHIDAFIVEDELGMDVLYHLNKHPEEADRLLQMTPTQQMRRLVAMATDLSPTSLAAGTTTAAPERPKPVILPKPPTVVRTEAQRASDAPPPTDGSLSLAEHRKHFGPKRR